MSDESTVASPPPTEAGRGGRLWKRLRHGLRRTHSGIFDRVGAAVAGRAHLDEDTLETLEEGLIAADLGVETSIELVEAVRSQAKRFEGGDLARLQQILVDHVAVLLLDAPAPPKRPAGPQVTLVVGVNGAGKTTSAAKLAKWYKDAGDRVLLAAADTFRAAAVEQLELWAERVDVDLVKQGPGADPAAVVFDALEAARARGSEQVIVDTAGRLHNREHLMAELAKIKRVIERGAGDWHRRTLLVLDATTGQNALSQAREFTRAVDVDGILLAKVDGTAKGGVTVAIARELRLPVLFLGVGEGADDLVEFRPRDFAAALVGAG